MRKRMKKMRISHSKEEAPKGLPMTTPDDRQPPAPPIETGGWENLDEISDLMGILPQTIISWSIHDKDWPCGPIFKEVVGGKEAGKERKEGNTFKRDWLAPGSFDLIVRVYPKKIMTCVSKPELAEENAALKDRLNDLELMVSELLDKSKA